MGHTEVVFFDAAGTLFKVRGSVGEVYCRIARDYGVDTDCHEVDRDFRNAFHRKSAQGLSPEQTGLDAEKAWWLDVVRQVFAAKMAPEVLSRYFSGVFEAFRSADAWELYPETAACLKRLRSCGYRLAVISNFDSRLLDVLANLGIDSYFEKVIISWRAGAAKPDPAIFRHALEATCCEALQALHVGDSLNDDVQGAEGAGIRGVLIDRAGKHTELPPARRIGTLLELFSLVSPQRTQRSQRTLSSL